MALDFVALSLLSAVLFAITRVIDKSVMKNFVDSALVVTFFSGIIGPFLFIPLIPFNEITLLPPHLMVLSFIGGLLVMAPTLIYFHATKEAEISEISVLYKMSPVFTILLAAGLLGEILTVRQYGGAILMILGSVIVSVESLENLKKLRFGKAFWLMVLATALLGAFEVLLKHLLQFSSYWNIYFWVRAGYFIAAMLIIPYFAGAREEILQVARNFREKRGHFILATETVSFLAGLILTMAIQLGPVSLVSAISGTQPFFVLLLVYALSSLGSETFEETFDRRDMMLKAVSVLLVVAGLYLATQ